MSESLPLGMNLATFDIHLLYWNVALLLMLSIFWRVIAALWWMSPLYVYAYDWITLHKCMFICFCLIMIHQLINYHADWNCLYLVKIWHNLNGQYTLWYWTIKQVPIKLKASIECEKVTLSKSNSIAYVCVNQLQMMMNKMCSVKWYLLPFQTSYSFLTCMQ